jgi:hypothetical protein
VTARSAPPIVVVFMKLRRDTCLDESISESPLITHLFSARGSHCIPL